MVLYYKTICFLGGWCDWFLSWLHDAVFGRRLVGSRFQTYKICGEVRNQTCQTQFLDPKRHNFAKLSQGGPV